MDEIILEKIDELKSMIESSDEYKILKICNENVNNSVEVIQIHQEIEALNEELENLEKVGGDSFKIEEIQKKINNLYLKMNQLDVVKEYNEAYKNLAEIYSLINFEIIYPLNINLERKKWLKF